MLRANLTLLALTGALTLIPAGVSNETKKDEKKAAPVKQKFCVYGGGCSRSIRLQGTYDSVAAACAAAEQFRNKDTLRFVTVRTGGSHDKDYFGFGSGVPGVKYQVYRLLCRSGWQLHSSLDSADKAKALTDQLTKEGNRIEVVVHYPAK